MQAAVFANPTAGRGTAKRKLARVRDEFARRDYSAKFIESASAEHFREELLAAIAEGCRPLVALGGDGTLQMVAGEALSNDIEVGIIPAGGGNDFATALGIPKDASKAAEILVAGNLTRVDVVRARFSDGSERVYLGGGGTGLDAEAARYSNDRFKSWPGRLRYVASAVNALRKFHGIDVEVEFPDGEASAMCRRVLLAAALNTPSFGGGLRLNPDAKLNDGKLEVVALGMLRKREVLALLPRLLLTGELKTGRVTRVQAKTVRISASSNPWFQGDGELLGRLPVELTVWPSALKMLAPLGS